MTAGLDARQGPLDTDLDLVVAGLCVPCAVPCAVPCRSATDLERFLVTFPALWLSTLGADGSALSKLALDFQMDPIFDWTILPLNMPGAGLDDCTAGGGLGASAAIFLFLTACSVRKALLYVCSRRTSETTAPFPSFCSVFTFFRASPVIDFVSTCLVLALRGTFFAKVAPFSLLFR